MTRWQRQRVVSCQASKDGGDGKADGGKGSGKKGGGDNKADFSAFWSLKVRNFFSARRQYLEGADQKKVKRRPEVLDRLDAELAKQQEELAKLEASEPPSPTMEQVAQGRVQREAEASARAAKMLEPLQVKLLGEVRPELNAPPSASAVTLEEVRSTLVPTWLDWVELALLRAKQFLQAVLTSPWALLVAAHAAWQQLFTSQRYEMFLMSEGERIWYWRNRMENERWFWEAFAWDRLIFPVLVTISYQYIVPNNLIWTVIVPCVFLVWQTGRLPGPFGLEFWLIAYFGVYKKCWPDVLAASRALFLWA